MTDDANIVETVLRHAPATIHRAESGNFAILRDAGGDQLVHDLEQFQARPDRLIKAVSVRTPLSLARYMDLYAAGDHLARVDAAGRRVDVDLDYHHAIDRTATGGAAVPTWNAHSVIFQPEFTPAYDAWHMLDRKMIGQIDAMEFLEDRLRDVIAPDAAEIMDMIMNFDALTKVTFRSRKRLSDGRVQFAYSEEDAVSGNVTCHEQLTIRVPVFDGAEPEPIDIRVRHRTPDGKLSFTFVIANREELERAAFDRACDVWRTALKLPFDLREVSV